MTRVLKSVVSCCVTAFLAFTVAVGPLHATGATSEPANESERIIRSEFGRLDQGRHLILKRHHRSGTLELCGDTCDFFAWEKPRSTQEVWDFVIFYEYQRGIGSQLEGVTETYKPRVAVFVPELLARYKKYCSVQNIDDELVSCVLEKLAERNGLRIGYVNYDEGARCQAWGDLRDRGKISEYQCTEAGKNTRSATEPRE